MTARIEIDLKERVRNDIILIRTKCSIRQSELEMHAMDKRLIKMESNIEKGFISILHIFSSHFEFIKFVTNYDEMLTLSRKISHGRSICSQFCTLSIII